MSAVKKQPDTAEAADLRVILDKVSLFAEVKDIPGASSEIFSLMKVRNYKTGDTIIAEGESGSDFFVLADGSAGVYKKTQDGDLYKVVILHGHMGTFFGEGALLEADTRSATICAESECRCLVLSKIEFEKFCIEHPDWALPIIKRVAKAVMIRLKNMNNDLSLLYKALVDEFSQR
jgi:CRP/FNR family cyclic AMP-dependent transcriptional regulator